MGYMTVGEKGHRVHVLDEAKAPYIKKAFELYASGQYSLFTLNNLLYSEGLRTSGGRKLSKARLHELFSDPFYYGMIRWGDQVYQGKQEPLVSKDLFDKVQSILHSRGTPRYRKHFSTLKAMMRCGECDCTITSEEKVKNQQNGNVHHYTYYRCTHFRPCSQRAYSREEELEEQLLDGPRGIPKRCNAAAP